MLAIFLGVKQLEFEAEDSHPNQCRGHGNVDIYLHSTIRLHSVVLNYLKREREL
jgi:hypothetical protein